MLRSFTCLLALTAMSTVAAAHPGEHGHMSLVQIIGHYAEADHLAFLALTVIVGWVAYRLGRRAEAHAVVRSKAHAPDGIVPEARLRHDGHLKVHAPDACGHLKARKENP